MTPEGRAKLYQQLEEIFQRYGKTLFPSPSPTSSTIQQPSIANSQQPSINPDPSSKIPPLTLKQQPLVSPSQQEPILNDTTTNYPNPDHLITPQAPSTPLNAALIPTSKPESAHHNCHQPFLPCPTSVLIKPNLPILTELEPIRKNVTTDVAPIAYDELTVNRRGMFTATTPIREVEDRTTLKEGYANSGLKVISNFPAPKLDFPSLNGLNPTGGLRRCWEFDSVRLGRMIVLLGHIKVKQNDKVGNRVVGRLDKQLSLVENSQKHIVGNYGLSLMIWDPGSFTISVGHVILMSNFIPIVEDDISCTERHNINHKDAGIGSKEQFGKMDVVEGEVLHASENVVESVKVDDVANVGIVEKGSLVGNGIFQEVKVAAIRVKGLNKIMEKVCFTNVETLGKVDNKEEAVTENTTANNEVTDFRDARTVKRGSFWEQCGSPGFITDCGYEYEQSYAFLPLFPLSIKLLSRTIFASSVPLIGYRAVLALSGYVISNAAFVFAALYLYRLSVAILKDSDTALQASILFCFNPASIFYSSIYLESLYSLFSIAGLYHLISGSDNIAVLLCSNWLCKLTVQVLVVGALHCVCVFAPFVAFQAYGYSNICLRHSPGERSPWCEAKIPLLYNYIQSHCWFLEIFSAEAVAKLSTCIPSVVFGSVLNYLLCKVRTRVFYSLGFQAPKGQKRVVASFAGVDKVPRSDSAPLKEVMAVRASHYLRRRKQFIQVGDHADLPTESNSLERPRYLNAIIVPCILHFGFMAATAFFIMRVQVATRFLSASPPLYWFASYIMVSRTYKKWGYVIWAYCAVYILLGSMLFSNFYPFT